MSPTMGKLDFVLKKEKNMSTSFLISRRYYLALMHLLTDVEKPNFSSHDGGSIGINTIRVELDITDRIVWDNLNNKIENVLNASNKLFSKHGIDTVLSFEKLRVMLHQFWKSGYLSFSDK